MVRKIRFWAGLGCTLNWASVLVVFSVSLWMSSRLWQLVGWWLQPEGRLQTWFLPQERQLHHLGTERSPVSDLTVPSVGCRASYRSRCCSSEVSSALSLRCTCLQGYVGNGKMCYGNIMERLNDLNTDPGGEWSGQLTSAISLFGTGMILSLLLCQNCQSYM